MPKIICLLSIMGAVVAIILVSTLPVLLSSQKEVAHSLTVPGCIKYKTFEINEDVLVTLCKEQSVCYLDVRKFLRRKNGTYFATIKGIRLSLNNWNVLKSYVTDIDKQINKMY